jgi:lipopolysaccharide export system protein LptC
MVGVAEPALPGERRRLASRAGAWVAIGRMPHGGGGRSHSRRVALLKRLLPAIGVALLLLIVVWPRLAPQWERMRLAFPAINLRDARELDMIHPRYAGIDREGHPFVVTAASGRQLPDRQDLMSLRGPRADIKTHGGADIVITAQTGVYQSQTQLLDLFGNVTLVHQNGTRFLTQAAHVEVASDRAAGDQPVTGHGPSGDVRAQGFRILDRGDRIVFTGRSDLLLKGARPTAATKHPPAALPAAVAAAARQTEAAAKPLLAAAVAAASHPTVAVLRRPLRRQAAHVRSRSADHRTARHVPVRRKPAAAKLG